MISIESIEIRNFKRIESFSCIFADLTLLVGLNNAGKTSVLQAIALACAVRKAAKPDLRGIAVIPFGSVLSAVQVPDANWLLPLGSEAEPTLKVHYSDGLRLDLWRSSEGDLSALFHSVNSEADFMGAQFVLPPGLVAAREQWVNQATFASQVSAGTAGAMFRNSIW